VNFEVGDPTYGTLLAEIKAAVGAARLRTARVVSHAVVDLYWQVGHLILQRQDEEGWGTRVIERLSVDLRTEFPGIRGFGVRSLVYMRTLANAYPEGITQEPLAQLPWSHITVLLDKVPNPEVRAWYAANDVQHGWSAAVLTHHIGTGRHDRVGVAPNNFPQVLASADSDQAREILQDPYALDFLALEPRHTERDLEDALVARLTRFLSELGTGFAFVGQQHKITVGSRDYFIDLLFYHLELRRFIVFELKAVAAEPEHIGKLNFYVNVVDAQLRKEQHGDRPTIGILLAADRDDVAVQYYLQGLTTPLAVSTYRALPDEVRPALPSSETLADLVRRTQQEVATEHQPPG
jgi:predicted nuclease of restriction endonuclease-like (RecB) superfamily